MTLQSSFFEFSDPAPNPYGIASEPATVRVVDAPEAETLIGRGVGEYIAAHHRNGEDVRLTDRDVPALVRATVKLLALFLDYKPHTWTEMHAASGVRECTRRARDLRAYGFALDVQRDGDARQFTYRLLPFDEAALTATGRAVLSEAKKVQP